MEKEDDAAAGGVRFVIVVVVVVVVGDNSGFPSRVDDDGGLTEREGELPL